MSDDVNLTVPADPRFRDVAPEVVGRYVVAVGGTEAQAAAMAAQVGQAMTQVGSGDALVHLDLRAPSGSAEVTLRCQGRSSVVTVPTGT